MGRKKVTETNRKSNYTFCCSAEREAMISSVNRFKSGRTGGINYMVELFLYLYETNAIDDEKILEFELKRGSRIK